MYDLGDFDERRHAPATDLLGVTIMPLALLPLASALALLLTLLTAGASPPSFEVSPDPSVSTQGRAVLHVDPGGSDTNVGTATAPFRSVQRGINAASAGDTILVHAGTYEGAVTIRKSGEANRPIVLMSAGDGRAVLTAPLKPVPCDATSPAGDRTVQIPEGDDHIVIQGLTIIGGIDVSGTNNNALRPYVQDRTLPGRGRYDPAGADSTLPKLGSNPADSIRIVGNVIERRGIDITNSRRGVIADNEIRDIDCGTGGGIWLHRFDDKYHIVNNYIHDIAASPNHWVSEGIRLGSQSSYNVIEYNTVERTNGPGRGITADVHAGWNVYRYNVARDTHQGFSEQAGGWGNRWLYNVAERSHKYGFNVYSKGGKGDGEPRTPRRERPGRRSGSPRAGNEDGTPRYVELRCNRSIDNTVDLNVGDVSNAVFANNDFRNVIVSEKLRRDWEHRGNRYDDLSGPPPAEPASHHEECETPGRVGSDLAP